MTAKAENQQTDARLASRRAFLRRSSAVIAGTALGGSVAAQARAAETEPIKVGLYSITYMGIWYRGKALTLEEVIQRAKQYGFDGLEIDGKRPHGNPLDMPAARCREIRRLADGEGIDIYAVAANNDFSSPVPEYRECQLVYIRELLRMTSELGANLLRVFLAWPGVTLHDHLGRYDVARRAWREAHKEFSAEQIWSWCRECLVESARFAGEFGVTLALQNHGPVIEGHGDVLRMIREVNSSHLKACIDAPLLKDKVLRDLLRGIPPMFFLNLRDRNKWRRKIIDTCAIMSDPAAAVMYDEMLTHKWLTDDQMVQCTQFTSGVEITVNFDEIEREGLPGKGYRVLGVQEKPREGNFAPRWEIRG